MKQLIQGTANVIVGNLRGNNEDNLSFNGEFLTEETREQPLVTESVCNDKRQFYAVCDGMCDEQLDRMDMVNATLTGGMI